MVNYVVMENGIRGKEDIESKRDMFVIELQKEAYNLASIMQTTESRTDELCKKIEADVGKANEILGVVKHINLAFDKNYETDVFNILKSYSEPLRQM